MKIKLFENIKKYLCEKEEQQYREYINERDKIIYDLTREWTYEEVVNFNYSSMEQYEDIYSEILDEKGIKKYILLQNASKYFNEDDVQYFINEINNQNFNTNYTKIRK